MPKLHRESQPAAGRLIAPRTEREVMLFTGAFCWAVQAGAIFLVSTLIPELVPHNRIFWTIALNAVALAAVVSHLTWMRRIGEAATYVAANVWCLVIAFVYIALLQIAPDGRPAVYVAMFIPAIYAAHALRKREAAAQVGALGAVALGSAIWLDATSSGPSMLSRVVVFVLMMSATSIAVFALKQHRQRVLSDAETFAATDPLSGLLNLRALRNRADELFDKSLTKSGKQVGLLLIDLDNFKRANSLHGHTGGDHVLRTIALGLSHAASPDHTVARIGGDEFAVLIADANSIDLANLAIRYRRAVQSARSKASLPGVEIDASVGCAITGVDGDTLEELLTAADRSMYEMKSQHERSRPTVRNRAAGAPAPVPLHANKASTSWVTPEPAQDRRQPNGGLTWNERPLHTRFACGTWAFGTTAVLLSLILPGSDHSHLTSALVALLVGGYGISIICYFAAPAIGSWEHPLGDAITLASIAFITYLTGGSASPAWALVFLFIIYEAWFLDATAIWIRLIGPIAVILLPLIYENFSELPNPTATGTMLYAGVAVAIGIGLFMSYDQYYLERARRVTARLATIDPLTGLWNRREFERRVAAELGQLSYNTADELAVVMIDLDDFKAVNTAHGHQVGDELLADIGHALSATARGEDCVARIGGDEFAIVLSGVSAEDASALARRFVEAVVEKTSRSEHAACREVGASAGFALYPIHGRTLDDLTSAADLALMTVKTGGKGTARVSDIVVAL